MATPIPLPLVIPLPDGTPPDEEVDKPIPGELVVRLWLPLAASL